VVRYIRLFAFHVLWTFCLTGTAVNAAEFYAIVERDGTVGLCLAKGAIVFADRCEGNGRLSIVQPLKEGAVVWRSAMGTVSLENTNPGCALSHAKWDTKTEEVIPTGRKISKVDRTDLMKRLIEQKLFKKTEIIEDDITAFALDLDGDGKDEIVFVASNLKRVADHYTDNERSVLYFVYAGVLKNNSQFPTLFNKDRDDYSGGTDAGGDVTIRGVVPIAPGTGEIALLIKTSRQEAGTQTLIRYRFGSVQRIDTIEYVCD
jgi:hypothetical protein